MAREKKKDAAQQELPLLPKEEDPLSGWLARVDWHIKTYPADEAEEERDDEE